MEENMEGRVGSRWKTLKSLLSFKGIRCCGGIWGRSGNNSPLSDGEYEEEYSDLYQHAQQQQQEEEELGSHFDQEISISSSSAREIGALLAATEPGPGQPVKVSLMRLLEEREERERDDESHDDEATEEEGGEGEGGSSCCCVCMRRRKGAAFIPCGHTFCRTCARELWTSRRSCPLCNRLILEILDIF